MDAPEAPFPKVPASPTDRQPTRGSRARTSRVPNRGGPLVRFSRSSRGATSRQGGLAALALSLLMVVNALVVVSPDLSSAVAPTARAPALPTTVAPTAASSVLHSVPVVHAVSGPRVAAGHPRVAPVPGTRFGFWGPSGAPPGAPALLGPSGSIGSTTANCGSEALPFEAATFPAPNCFGNDEAAVQFYSPLAGSGGNVSWNLTLPVDASATQNQSDLYSAAWAGMVLSSPDAWMHECLLEVQFYPDHSWYAPTTTTAGTWSAAAVGWKIDPATGVEDTCFYSPLYQSGGGGAYLLLHQGDTVNLTLTGWPGDGTGEVVQLQDLTTGNSSGLPVYNATGGYPLDPAYSTSSGVDSLGWSSLGAYPVSFGFEVGRGSNSAVASNGTAGGCDPGIPPPTPSDGAVPCPSYDPTSWSNDTLAPWNIGTPQFFGGAGRDSPWQVAFASSVGGSGSFADRSNGSCTGRLGSSFCTYPWFSYTCALQAFEFGATDYPAVSVDFGQSNQFAANPVEGAGLQPYFPPTNFSTPGCGSGVGVTVTLNASAGTVEFLSHDYGSTPTPVQHVPPGSYSVSYLPVAGSTFVGWTTGGSVTVSDPAAPTTTLQVVGTGSVSADVRSGAGTRTVQYVDTSSSSGGLEIGPSIPTPAAAPHHVASGGSTAVAPGLYTVQALPPPGYCFASWRAPADPSALASTSLPETTVTVDAGASVLTLDESDIACPGQFAVELGTLGNGTVTLNGTSTVYNPATRTGSSTATVRAGSYPVFANPSRTWTFDQWTYGASAMMTNFTNATWVTVEPGGASLTATFAANVTLDDTPEDAGIVGFNETSTYDNGTSLLLPPGVYSFDAVPLGGFSFQRWHSSDSLHLWILRPRSAVTLVQVNASGTLTANYVTKTNNSVTFDVSPAGAGEIRFNVQNLYANATTTNSTVANGTYLLSDFETYGYRFTGWATTGPLAVGGGVLTVSGTGGTLTAKFVVRLFPVTFVALPAGAVSAKINGTSYASGGTAHLALGTYAINATISAGDTWVGWFTGFTVGGAGVTSVNATVVVTGSGSIGAAAVTFQSPTLGSSPTTTDVGYALHFTAFANGSGPLKYRYGGLPTGCASRDTATLTCTPSGAGVFSVTVTITGAQGNSLRSLPLSVTVVAAPAITAFTALPADLTVGTPTTLAVTASGGVSALGYGFTGLPAGCSGSTATFGCTPTATGTFRVQAEASDALGVASFANVTLTVEARPSITSFSATPSAVTVGINSSLATVVAGPSGAWSYGYLGLPAGCASLSVATLVCAPTAPGTYNITVIATDHLGANASASLNLTVNAAPVVTSFSASPSPVVVGTSVQFTVRIAGGTGPWSYAYSGLPTGCGTTNASTLTCSPTVEGMYTVTVHVQDRFGRSASASTTLTVSPQSTSPPSNGTSPAANDWWVIGLVILVALAILLEVVYLLRRQAQKKP